MTTRKATAWLIAFASLLLTAACSTLSEYGPVDSAHFDRIVKRSLAGLGSDGIYSALRGRWLPHERKEPAHGIFVTTGKGLVFATWNASAKRYRPRYAVAYDRLSTVRLKKEGFQKRLRVETRSRRVDYFEILTQDRVPPYVVNNDLTEEVFELLKKIRREQASPRRHAAEAIEFGRAKKRKFRKPGPSDRRSGKRPSRQYRR